MRILCEPLRKRFRFHFMGDRDTNQLDKVGRAAALATGAQKYPLIAARSGRVQPCIRPARVVSGARGGDAARPLAVPGGGRPAHPERGWPADVLGQGRPPSLGTARPPLPCSHTAALDETAAAGRQGEFARQMADIVSERLRADWPELMDLPELMIHTVHEVCPSRGLPVENGSSLTGACAFGLGLLRVGAGAAVRSRPRAHPRPAARCAGRRPLYHEQRRLGRALAGGPPRPCVRVRLSRQGKACAHEFLPCHAFVVAIADAVAERQVAEVVEAGDAFARHFGGVADDLVRTTVCAERSLALLRGMTGTIGAS